MKSGVVWGWTSEDGGATASVIVCMCWWWGCEWEFLHCLRWASSHSPQLELVVRPLKPGAWDFPAGIASWSVGIGHPASRFPAPFT